LDAAKRARPFASAVFRRARSLGHPINRNRRAPDDCHIHQLIAPMPGHDTRIEEQKGNDVKAIVIADGQG
jgi:hypothetical protein